MDKKLNGKATAVLERIQALAEDDAIPDKYPAILKEFWESYQQVVREHGNNPETYTPIFNTLLDLIDTQCHTPFQFDLYHKKVRSPFDYYQFGLDFLRPLVDMPHSTVHNIENLNTMEALIQKKDNVILFANHQIEADPQAISLLLEPSHPRFGEELIFVAGARVTSDPMAIPFSIGRNLLCIYSKKYIDHPPEEKHTKQMHNKRTMQRMAELLSEGGHAIYVAPSGGRDRTNPQGEIELAPFDPQSIEMFYLMAKKAQRPTHFFPLALSTYHLLPPAESIKLELGESRITRGGAIHLSFGSEIDMEHFPGASEAVDKKAKKYLRTKYIWDCVKHDYDQFPL